MRIHSVVLYACLLWGILGLSSVRAEPPVTYVGGTTQLTDEIDELIAKVRSGELPPEKVEIAISHILLAETAEDGGLKVDEVSLNRFRETLSELEEAIHRPIPVQQTISSAAEFEKVLEYIKSSSATAPVDVNHSISLRELRERVEAQLDEAGEPKFITWREAFKKSFASPVNTAAARIRAVQNGVLILAIMNQLQGTPFWPAAAVGAAGGYMSGLMARSNDVYKEYLASPYSTKLPSYEYKQRFKKELAKLPHSQQERIKTATLGMGTARDFPIITVYILGLAGVGELTGIDSFSLIGISKSIFLSMISETSLNLANAHLTQEAIADIPDDANPEEREALIRTYRNRSVIFASHLQSPILTSLAAAVSQQITGAEGSFWVISGASVAALYMSVVAPEKSRIGQLRRKYLDPAFHWPVSRIERAAEVAQQSRAYKSTTHAIAKFRQGTDKLAQKVAEKHYDSCLGVYGLLSKAVAVMPKRKQ